MKIMPFSSWKKRGKNSSNISQFVRDHIESHRRRGGPLVVETGFPTSLVDLIVKNRQRLKKSSEIEIIPHNSSFALGSPSPSPLPLPLPLQPPPPPSSPTLSDHVLEERGDTVVEVVKEDDNCKGVLMAVLRVSFVVVLALGTKKFAVGLTMSAFFLICLEYVGKLILGLVIPCSDSREGLRLMVVRLLRFVRIGEKKLESKNAGFKVGMKSGGFDSKNNSQSDSIGEIQIMQSKSLLVDEIQILPSRDFMVASSEDVQYKKDGIDESGYDRNLKLIKPDSLAAFLEEADDFTCDLMEIKKKKSRGAKMKSKLKHIFRRKSKREQKHEGIWESDLSLNGESNAMILEAEEEEGQGSERKLECDSNLSSILSASYEGKEAITMVSHSEMALVEVKEVMDGVAISKMEENPRQANSGYLLLCVIVLIGLFGGRMSALILILSWCVLRKSGGNLRRSILPVIRHFCPNVQLETQNLG